MKVQLFESPSVLEIADQMSYGGEVKPRKMQRGGEPGIGFNPLQGLNLSNINEDIAQQVRDSIAESMQGMPNYEQMLANIESRLDSGLSEQDVATQISEAVASLPEGLTEADIQRVIDANPGLTREDVLSIIESNPGISFQDVESAINTALEGSQNQISSSIQELRALAEQLYEREDFYRDPNEGDVDAQREIQREQFIENFIEQNRDRLIGEAPDFQQLIQNQINNQIQDGTIASGDIVTEQSLAERLAAGTLTPEEIQQRIDAGDITKQDVLDLIQGGFSFNEGQFAQLFNAGILTRDEIAALIDQAVSEIDTGGEDSITAEQVQEIAEAAGLTEDQVLELIGTQLEGYSPDLDLSQYATQEQLGDFATQEQLQGLESMFQNYLTPEQLQSYLPQEGQYITPEQLAEATDNDYDEVIKGLTDQLGDLETKYQDVQSQYEADAVQSQIDQTKDDLNNFFRGAVPSGPRTGSTSQFSSGASFLPGGSPMANLIGGQRQGLGQDPFSTYLKTFTPSYTAYDAPVTPEEYGQASTPLIDTQYTNPFTGGSSYSGGYNQGGQVSNGIMDLTNFDTNVQPFQNAFRPNVPRN
jgi:uncharacterized protein YidB (DUF937 family)